jgi:prevent-host-death family protein
MKTIGASKFKAECLALLDRVAETHEPIVVTKWGKPVATLVPYTSNVRVKGNPLKHSVVFEKDIVAPLDEKWDAE